MEHQPLLCPFCGSQSLSANQETFNQTRAAIGNMAFGSKGLMYGLTGPKNIIITCLSCGNNFKPGEGANDSNFQEKNGEALQRIEDIKMKRQGRRVVAIALLVLIVIVLLLAYSSVTNQ